MNQQATRLSRKLSWLLRHGAGQVGLAMDTAGWVEIGDVLAALGITRAQLLDAVRANDKGRLQLDGGRVRACQGHSLERMPVRRAALEGSWEVATGTGSLWHGTLLGAVEGIAADGVRPIGRSHVHLAAAPDSRVGKRAHVDLLLEIAPARLTERGISVFRAPNGVLLARHVPAACITSVRPASRRGRELLPWVRQVLPLA